ncbi:putative 3-hydroxyphenylpropionic transporter MhpT [compost metagenome]
MWNPACTIGTQILANACTVQFYPAHIRSTGLGWAMGIGRIGAIIGPLLGGALHAAQLPLQASFLAFALPGLIGAVAILMFIWHRPDHTASVSERPLESAAG